MLQMMHKMMCMVHVMKILPSSMSLMLKLMIWISSHQYQKIHQQFYIEDLAEIEFLPPGIPQISMWCYYLMVQNLSVLQMQWEMSIERSG